MNKGITIWSGNQLFSKGEITVRGFIEYAAKLGFEGIDLGYFWQDRKNEFQELPKWLAENRIALSGYIVGNNFGGVVGTDKEAGEIKKVFQAIDEAKIIGANRLRIFAGGRDGLGWEEGSKMVLDCFQRCTEYAEKQKIKLALEDHHGLASNSEQVLFYVKKINSPYFGVTVDIGNFLFGQEDPIVGTRNTAPYAYMVHVKDWQKLPDGKLLGATVGDGVVDVRGCLKVLKESGYQGFLSLEYEGQEDARKGIERSLRHMEKCLAEI